MVFIANNVLSGMYLNNDPKVQAIYSKAYQQIATSNNTEAIQNLVNDIVAKDNNTSNIILIRWELTYSDKF